VSIQSAHVADDLDTARETILKEAFALEQLGHTIDVSIVRAADQILGCRGRVVVCGIGKSGIAARKIVATLASFGTAALFLHAGDALHGDLGKLIPGDVLLAISVSGETAEILAVVAHAHMLNVAIIAISMNAHSTLAANSDLLLSLPDVDEGSPEAAAPMASTVMTIALGDALACILARRCSFSREGLARLHPGGSIGLRLRPVSRIMHAGGRMPIVAAQATLDDVLNEIDSKGFGIVGVIDPVTNALTGVITDGDLRRHFRDSAARSAKDLQTSVPVTVSPDAENAEVLALLRSRRISAVFVVDPFDGAPLGLIHLQDLLRTGIL
jgi:arabinose-5-phosphate isomerase